MLGCAIELLSYIMKTVILDTGSSCTDQCIILSMWAVGTDAVLLMAVFRQSSQKCFNTGILSWKSSLMLHSTSERWSRWNTFIEIDLSYNPTALSTMLLMCEFSLDSCYSKVVFITSYLCYWLKSKTVQYRGSTRDKLTEDLFKQWWRCQYPLYWNFVLKLAFYDQR